MLRIETIDATKYLTKDMCSTTIENIAYEKYISEEVSRVDIRFDGGLYLFSMI